MTGSHTRIMWLIGVLEEKKRQKGGVCNKRRKNVSNLRKEIDLCVKKIIEDRGKYNVESHI